MQGMRNCLLELLICFEYRRIPNGLMLTDLLYQRINADRSTLPTDFKRKNADRSTLQTDYQHL